MGNELGTLKGCSLLFKVGTIDNKRRNRQSGGKNNNNNKGEWTVSKGGDPPRNISKAELESGLGTGMPVKGCARIWDSTYPYTDTGTDTTAARRPRLSGSRTIGDRKPATRLACCHYLSSPNLIYELRWTNAFPSHSYRLSDASRLAQAALLRTRFPGF